MGTVGICVALVLLRTAKYEVMTYQLLQSVHVYEVDTS